jgi:hypothetical protein
VLNREALRVTFLLHRQWGPDYCRLNLFNLKGFFEGDPCLDHLVFAQMLYWEEDILDVSKCETTIVLLSVGAERPAPVCEFGNSR